MSFVLSRILRYLNCNLKSWRNYLQYYNSEIIIVRVRFFSSSFYPKIRFYFIKIVVRQKEYLISSFFNLKTHF
jgi:hypothetical protein